MFFSPHSVNVVFLLYCEYNHGISQAAHGFPLCKSISEPKALCLCVGVLSNSQKRLKIATRWAIFY